jgi:hypothetical protein
MLIFSFFFVSEKNTIGSIIAEIANKITNIKGTNVKPYFGKNDRVLTKNPIRKRC